MKARFIMRIVVGVSLIGVVWAGEEKAGERTELLAGHVPASVVEKQTPTASDPVRQSLRWENWELTDVEFQIKSPRRSLTSGERWTRFEQEYTPTQRYGSAVQDSLMGMKYQLDRTVFALDQFVEDAEDLLELEYRFRDGRFVRKQETASTREKERVRPAGNVFDEMIHNARFRTDVRLGFSDNYVGLRLDFPLGDQGRDR